ncbi:hypothetical protein V5E97_25175 [Singulisphaera sp. Ch08]|uniref:Uncharacterized protein n=1 Tax=Singulisphaera sp. Ch08 TaxID=3120278 RepID=A0AAU7C8A1_9BACT
MTTRRAALLTTGTETETEAACAVVGFPARTIGSITGIGDGPAVVPVGGNVGLFGSTIPIGGDIPDIEPEIEAVP